MADPITSLDISGPTYFDLLTQRQEARHAMDEARELLNVARIMLANNSQAEQWMKDSQAAIYNLSHQILRTK